MYMRDWVNLETRFMKPLQKNLALGFSAGSRAIENYDACCKLFGFKSAMRGNFAPQKRLYAKNATIEGFNVWMIAHSNFSEPFNNNGKWYNIIEGELIKEVWFVANELLEAPNERAFRVSFVKKYGKYIFQGVYAQQKIEWETMPNGKRELVRIFRRISETYPITSGDSIELPEISNIDDIGEKRKELACVTEKCEIKARLFFDCSYGKTTLWGILWKNRICFISCFNRIFRHRLRRIVFQEQLQRNIKLRFGKQGCYSAQKRNGVLYSRNSWHFPQHRILRLLFLGK